MNPAASIENTEARHRFLLFNVPDQRPGSNGSRLETEASSPRSLRLVCLATMLSWSPKLHFELLWKNKAFNNEDAKRSTRDEAY